MKRWETKLISTEKRQLFVLIKRFVNNKLYSYNIEQCSFFYLKYTRETRKYVVSRHLLKRKYQRNYLIRTYTILNNKALYTFFHYTESFRSFPSRGSRNRFYTHALFPFSNGVLIIILRSSQRSTILLSGFPLDITNVKIELMKSVVFQQILLSCENRKSIMLLSLFFPT